MRFDLCRVGPFLSRNVLSQRVASLFTFFHFLFCSSWADLELNSSCALIFRFRCRIESVWPLAHIHARAKALPSSVVHAIDKVWLHLLSPLLPTHTSMHPISPHYNNPPHSSLHNNHPIASALVIHQSAFARKVKVLMLTVFSI